MVSPRVVIVSNRLPVTIAPDRSDGVELIPSTGGLATGLASVHERYQGPWVGWCGSATPTRSTQRLQLHQALDEARLVPVDLSVEEVRRYYEGFSNGVVWPLFHYLLDRVPRDAHEWHAYEAVNSKFAEATLRVTTPDSLIWVQDYQLMLVPALIRQRLPEARIGFFLHIPFPAFEVFRLLPWRRRILTGLLGADLIGFHTETYARHCIDALEHLMHLEFGDGRAEVLGRRVRVAAPLMGIDVERFSNLARSDNVAAQIETIRAEAGSRRLLVGVDRLDYTKGIPRRLLAFDRLLKRHPEWRDTVRFVQVAVPSRDGIENYRAFRREVNELVGRINGQASTVGSVPLHYMHRSLAEHELVALYRAADAMVVTPLRDGMNLVAKEFSPGRARGLARSSTRHAMGRARLVEV